MQIAQIALGVSINLHSYYRKARDAPQRAQELQDRLNSLLDTLVDVQEALESPEFVEARSGPPIKDFMQIKWWLSEAQKRTSPKSTHGILRRLKWPLDEAWTNDIIKEINSLIQNLATRITTRTLYSTGCRFSY